MFDARFATGEVTSNSNMFAETQFQRLKEDNYLSESEKTPLSRTAEFTSQYETIKEGENNTLIYCHHGNVSDECCGLVTQEEGKNDRKRKESHCHSDENINIQDKSARKRLVGASILCLVFMIGEIIGGYFANSLAVMTDAAHLLTDFASFMISLFSIWMASRPRTKQMSFGWYRAEVIGALTSVIMIWVVTGILVYLAVERIVSGRYEVDAVIMLITSGIGVFVNIVMGVSLYFGGVSHGHSHGGDAAGKSHQHSHGGGGGNINVRAAFIHVLGDLVQSIGVLVAATIIFFKPNLVIVDPICTFMFSLLVLFTTYNIIKDTLHVLMEGMPRGFDFNEVQEALTGIPGVVTVHNLRIWALTLDKIALSVHLAIDRQHSPMSVLRQASYKIRHNYNVFELTIQIEEYKEVMRDCGECQSLKD